MCTYYIHRGLPCQYKLKQHFIEIGRIIPLLAKGSMAPIIEAFAELTGISTRALFGLCGSSYVILSIPASTC